MGTDIGRKEGENATPGVRRKEREIEKGTLTERERATRERDKEIYILREKGRQKETHSDRKREKDTPKLRGKERDKQ